MEFLEKVRLQISNILEIDSSNVYLHTTLYGSEGWDSFAMLSAIAIVSEHTGKQVTLDKVEKLATVSEFLSLLKQQYEG